MGFIVSTLFLVWFHSLVICSNGEIYLSEMLDKMPERWMETYVTALYSVCQERTYMCEHKIIQGNVTVEPILPPEERTCCLIFDCFGSCLPEEMNCFFHIEKDLSSMTRQYLEYTSCMDSYKYLDENSKTNLYNGQYGHITVSFCPKNADIQEKLLCENMTKEELRPVVDTIPVTGNNVHFANKYCASCHGVKSDYVFWDVNIQ